MKVESLQWLDVLSRLAVLVRLEKKLLRYLLVYAITIAILNLIVPLTVQELVNTFAYAIQPLMIVTLVGVMTIILLVVGSLRALQFYVMEMLERRIFSRVALALAENLPSMSVATFKPQYANRFIEAVFMQRSLSVLLIDGLNVIVGGLVGLSILVLYHPYFLIFDLVLVTGSLSVIILLSAGGHRATLAMSRAKYDTLNWIQEMAHNLLHFKVTDSREALLIKTDTLALSYIGARKRRFRIILRQYLAWVAWQAVSYGGMVGFAGWLLAIGQLTLGQFVAAEVIVGSLLLSLDSVMKRIPHAFYLLTAVTELDGLFSMPRDRQRGSQAVTLPDPTLRGLHIECHDLGYADENGTMLFEHVNLDLQPRSRVSIQATSTSGQVLTRVLAGLDRPSAGSIRYNGVDARDLNPVHLRGAIGVVFDYQPTLFDGTLVDNITMGRPSIDYQDILWAIGVVELEDEVAALPESLQTPVSFRGKAFTTSLVQRILVARAIVRRPQLLLLEGTLPSIPLVLRDRILQRLFSREQPWSIVCISSEPFLVPDADAHLVLD